MTSITIATNRVLEQPGEQGVRPVSIPSVKQRVMKLLDYLTNTDSSLRATDRSLRESTIDGFKELGKEAFPYLIEALQASKDKERRCYILFALASLELKESVPYFTEIIQNERDKAL